MTKDNLTEKYPYFVDALADALETAADPDARQTLRRRLAVNIGDRDALRRLLGLDPEEFASFYPDLKPKSLSTADTIDSFLSRFAPPGAPLPDEIPIAPAIDYATLLEAEQRAEVAPPEAAPLSESLARMMVRERNYTKALEIITGLSLKNPEKSIYFADQIRFLNKLIKNEKAK